MITKSNIIGLLGTAIFLHGAVPEIPSSNAISDVAYIGSAIPLQSPRILVFQFRVDSSNLEVFLPLNLECNAKYTVKYDGRELSASLQSSDSIWLFKLLSQVHKEQLLASEAHDLLLVLKLIEKGECIKTKDLRSLNDPLANWAETERAEENLVYRIYRTSDNEWQCVGNPYSWGIKLRNGDDMFLFMPGSDQEFSVTENPPLSVIIRESLLRFERELKSRPKYMFGDQSLKLFGPISMKDTLDNIQRIRNVLHHNTLSSVIESR